MQVRSTIKLNMPRINQLTEAAVKALEMTGEALHTEVVQAQVMPFDTGHLEEDATFVDYSESKNGKVTLVSSTPYASISFAPSKVSSAVWNINRTLPDSMDSFSFNIFAAVSNIAAWKS